MNVTFDTVKHAPLFDKLLMLNMPDKVYNWMRDYFQGHSHCTKFDSHVLAFLIYMRQCFKARHSALRRTSSLLRTCRTRHHENRLLKYADDTYLIVPAVVSHTVEEELNHIAEWSRANNLKLNQSKSQQTIFIAPGARRTLTGLPDPIQGIKRLEAIKGSWSHHQRPTDY